MDDYSYDELLVHYEAVLRCRAEVTKHLAQAIRIANNAKNRQFGQYVKGLEETGKRLDLAFGRRAEVDTSSFFSKLDQLTGAGKTKGDGNS